MEMESWWNASSTPDGGWVMGVCPVVTVECVSKDGISAA